MKKFSKIYESKNITEDILEDYLQEFKDEEFNISIIHSSSTLNGQNFNISLQNEVKELDLIDISKFFSMLDELTNRISEHGYRWIISDLTYASNTRPGINIRNYLQDDGETQINIVKIHYTIEFFKKLITR